MDENVSQWTKICRSTVLELNILVAEFPYDLEVFPRTLRDLETDVAVPSYYNNNHQLSKRFMPIAPVVPSSLAPSPPQLQLLSKKEQELALQCTLAAYFGLYSIAAKCTPLLDKLQREMKGGLRGNGPQERVEMDTSPDYEDLMALVEARRKPIVSASSYAVRPPTVSVGVKQGSHPWVRYDHN